MLNLEMTTNSWALWIANQLNANLFSQIQKLSKLLFLVEL